MLTRIGSVQDIKQAAQVSAHECMLANWRAEILAEQEKQNSTQTPAPSST